MTTSTWPVEMFGIFDGEDLVYDQDLLPELYCNERPARTIAAERYPFYEVRPFTIRDAEHFDQVYHMVERRAAR